MTFLDFFKMLPVQGEWEEVCPGDRHVGQEVDLDHWRRVVGAVAAGYPRLCLSGGQEDRRTGGQFFVMRDFRSVYFLLLR